MTPKDTLGRKTLSMTPAVRLGLWTLLALVVSCVWAIGAPPSVSVRDGVWASFEWLMLPGLIGGPIVLIAVLALMLSLNTSDPTSLARAAVVACCGMAASAVGALVAWGIDAQATSPRALIIMFAALLVPFVGVVRIVLEAAHTSRRRDSLPT